MKMHKHLDKLSQILPLFLKQISTSTMSATLKIHIINQYLTEICYAKMLRPYRSPCTNCILLNLK